MPNHVWSTVCSKAILDRETNNISLIEVLEEIQFGPPPPDNDLGQEGYVMLPIPMTLVTLWERESGSDSETFAVRIKFVDPTGTWIGPKDTEREHTIDKLRFRSINRMMAVPFSESGRYIILVQSKTSGSGRWKQNARVPLSIIAKSESE